MIKVVQSKFSEQVYIRRNSSHWHSELAAEFSSEGDFAKRDFPFPSFFLPKTLPLLRQYVV